MHTECIYHDGTDYPSFYFTGDMFKNDSMIFIFFSLNSPCKPCLHNQTCNLFSNYQEPQHWFSYSVLPRELVLNSKRFCVWNTNAMPTKLFHSWLFILLLQNNFTCKSEWTSMENEKHCYKGISSPHHQNGIKIIIIKKSGHLLCI